MGSAEVVVAEGAGVEGAAAVTGAGAEAEALDLLDFLLFFVCGVELSVLLFLENIRMEQMHTSCQPHRGLKLSKNPTSSNRLGKSQRPGATVKTVMQKRIKRKIAMAKKRPNSPIMPTLRYHTPWRMIIGHNGNRTTAKIPATTAAAMAFCFHWGPSYSQT